MKKILTLLAALLLSSAAAADGLIVPAPCTAFGTATGTCIQGAGALGTPSGGTVTNLTGTASININGTVGATTPGTGAFTTLSASNTVTLGAAITFNGSSGFAANQIYRSSTSGLSLSGVTGSSYDFSIYSAAGLGLFENTTGTSNVTINRAAGVTTVGGTIIASSLTTAAGTPNSICQNNATKELTVNAALTCTVSSLVFKHDFAPISEAATPMLMAMRPGSFFYNDGGSRQRLGFGAEYVAAVDRRLADGWDESGNPKSIDQNAILAVVVKAFQELKADNDNLRKCQASWKCRIFGQ